MTIFDIFGIIAGLCTAIPSIPQIINTYKSKNVEGLSILMFIIWIIGGICWIAYGRYLKSWQMELFNSISLLCSIIMVLLIVKYKKHKK